MTDRYRGFANTGTGRAIVRRLGLPAPAKLRRHDTGDPDVHGPVLLGGKDTGLLKGLGEALETELGAQVHLSESEDAHYGAVVFDATGIDSVAGLRQLYDFFHPAVRRLTACGRVLVLGLEVREDQATEHAAAQAALDGFVRTVGKELRAGGTAQLLRVDTHDTSALESSLRFFLSARSAFVSGQVVHIGAFEADRYHRAHPLDGKVALVTGAAQGIGATTAQLLSRLGAHVMCLDVPAAGEKLSEVAGEISGTAMQLDITADDAPATLAARLSERHGGVDIVVHNAGITRDKTLAGMRAEQWDGVLAVNLAAPLRITEDLLRRELIRDGGRIVVTSSVMGIAGNRGQANYAASKAGLIGMVGSLSPRAAASGITVNAVAPGFIETRMTAKMPLALREVGRRLSSLAQGGLPIDVAETVAWLAHPGSGGVNGNVVRVCGQSFLGS
ncbi:MAG TPA: 3-oxoacyl-ACP reductase [Stackebrandtia sp.]|jgi:3-oxoacyl-[acyl-carrier protein] reductase|uniref:3-oxoacyl-ACP reductase n=1 Tax=Stackebrandtia sp. TaxID=2023065 RepID=UPI002D401959|nr:3-oxoacyl-ACP reductase [Stackebrandtia sp.]HZE41738.1 3-oxoacyl-ACP reductase [Stackebrandtia sp.]